MELAFEAIDETGEEVVIISLMKDSGPPDAVTYTVEVAVRDQGGDDHMYSRTVHNVNTLTTNPLGILQIVLDELPEGALTVERPREAEAAVPSALERRQPFPLRAVQAGQRQLRSD